MCSPRLYGWGIASSSRYGLSEVGVGISAGKRRKICTHWSQIFRSCIRRFMSFLYSGGHISLARFIVEIETLTVLLACFALLDLICQM